MKAVVFDRHGGPEVLAYREIPTPSPGRGKVLINVAACGVNHLDIWVRQGIPGNIPMPHIGGCEVVGTIAEVGEGVTEWRIGDTVLVSPGIDAEDSYASSYKVMGFQTQGGFAEYTVAPADYVFKISPRWKPEEWAVTPLVFLTAWHMLFTRARLQKGERVLIHGAGSGIGSAAIQLCKWHGCSVATTAGSDAKLEKARALGADHGINYQRHPDFHKEVRRAFGGRGANVVFEHIGKATWQGSLAALDPGGRLVFCGTTTGSDITMDLRFIFVRQLDILGSYMGAKWELAKCLELLEAGTVHPVLDTAYLLPETRAAQERMLTRNFFGKLAVKVG